MIKALLNQYNHLRKKRFFDLPAYNSKKKYAFIGVGMHSLSNLLPILHHFGISLKYVLTKSSGPYPTLQSWFPGSRITHTLSDLTGDPEVAAIFISSSPDSHYELLNKILPSAKKIFIEKPPCANSRELEKLIETFPEAICRVGLQRRYWPANTLVRRKIPSAKSYSYKFKTGPYLQEDPLTALFIHHLDYALQLFGPVQKHSVNVVHDTAGLTIQLQVLHDNGIPGLVELSTHHSWTHPEEEMLINTPRESLCVRYPMLVSGEIKPSRLFNIPSERLLKQPLIIKQYFSANNLIIPAAELNTLVLQGFFHEIGMFVELVEKNTISSFSNDLPGLSGVYKLIGSIRDQIR